MAYGAVHETFWDDPKMRALTERGRMLMLYLMTCRHRNRLGCFLLDPQYAAADLQWSVDEVNDKLRELIDSGRVEFDSDHRVVIITRYLRHNPLENPNVVKGAIRELGSIPQTPLLEFLMRIVENENKSRYAEIVQELGNRLANRSETLATRDAVPGLALPDRTVPTDNDSSLRSESAQAPDRVITSPQPNGTDPAKPMTLHQQAMPVLRELGFEAKKHDGSIVKAMAKKGLRWETIEPAVRGLAVMRDAGELRASLGISPGEQLNLRILYARDGPKDGAQPIWRVAENRWYQHLAAENRKNRGKMPKLRV